MDRVQDDYADTWLESHPGGTFRTDSEGYEDDSVYLGPAFDPSAPSVIDDAPAVFVARSRARLVTTRLSTS